MKVSIIVPVYNVERYVEKCIQSLLAQDCSDYEIIAVDDGSTDDSSMLLSAFSAEARLKIIKQSNQGLGGARNTGLRHATGEFVSFVDSDDWVSADFISNMLKEASDTGAEIVVCRYQQVTPEGVVHYQSQIKKGPQADEFFKRILAGKMSAMACDKLIKRCLFVDHNIRFPVAAYHEDVSTMFKLFFFANCVGVVEKPLYFWLRREGSISKSISKKHVRDIFDAIGESEAFLTKICAFDEYKKYHYRRAYHFSVSLYNRLLMYAEPEPSEGFSILEIADDIKSNFLQRGLGESDVVGLVEEYDRDLLLEMLMLMSSFGQAGDQVHTSTENIQLRVLLLKTQNKLSNVYSKKGYGFLLWLNRLASAFFPRKSSRRKALMRLLNGHTARSSPDIAKPKNIEERCEYYLERVNKQLS
jgi:glycosyltransferase involved in cell wall biosynthesis